LPALWSIGETAIGGPITQFIVNARGR